METRSVLPRKAIASLAIAAGVILCLQWLRRKKLGSQAGHIQQGHSHGRDAQSKGKSSRNHNQDGSGHSLISHDCFESVWLWLQPKFSRLLASCVQSWSSLNKDLDHWYIWAKLLSRITSPNSESISACVGVDYGERCSNGDHSHNCAAHGGHEQGSCSCSTSHEQADHSHAFERSHGGKQHHCQNDDSLAAHETESIIKKSCVRRWQRVSVPGQTATSLSTIADETDPSTAVQTVASLAQTTDQSGPSRAGHTVASLTPIADETGPSTTGQTATSLAPIPDKSGPSTPSTAALLVNKKLRISGFERVMKGTPPMVKAELLCSPPNSGRSDRIMVSQMSARSQTSARSVRSETSQRIIDDLHTQIAKLQDELAQDLQTPRSARSEKSQRTIDDLHAQIARLTQGRTPRSARSQASARSARSDTSQRIIYDLSVQIMKLKEELAQVSQTPRSARSEQSQRIIDDLNAQIAKLTETEINETPRSARSDASQRIIDDLQAQIAALKAENTLQKMLPPGSDASQHTDNALLVQIATPRDALPASDEHPFVTDGEEVSPKLTEPGCCVSPSSELAMLRCFKPEALLNSAPHARILAYGDCLSAGYSAIDSYGAKEFASYAQHVVEALVPDMAVELWVCGLSGATAAQLANESESGPIIDVAGKPGVGMKAALTMHGPFDLVLIMLGTIDLANSEQQTRRPALVMASKIFENIERIHTVCHERDTPTVVLSVPESRRYRLGLENDTDAHYCDCWRHLNSSLQKWATENQDEVKLFIDSGEVMPWSRGSEYWESDGIHFSVAGSRHFGTGIAKALLPVMKSIRRTREKSSCHDRLDALISLCDTFPQRLTTNCSDLHATEESIVMDSDEELGQVSSSPMCRTTRKGAGEIDFWHLPLEVGSTLPDPERLAKLRDC
eukprot:TRINITY_DN26941_c0_g1_i1.p1 TRINITY_DN26941_c0_g1~~TRINITY_DN26941_c0_g1_i1.p1  ORF type:complete len:908 (-),score=121.23 TRINITY_DN26941_c0_g1_i1:325-3048(-)